MTGSAVTVSAGGELPGEKNPAAALRVLVAGQHAGTIERDGRIWRASWQARSGSAITRTGHLTAADALTAVLQSGFARWLGARHRSPVFWSATAARLVTSAYMHEARTRDQHLTHEVRWPDGDLYMDAGGASRFAEGRARVIARHIGGTIRKAQS